ncbi:GNAT family N-acetyltransferase [Actinocrispum wychmicini]|uniref:Ribosomal protein S18 acetylase RimI-like enzyme n=1 Tax=Actinocrispum wychmicini TaxID=1213861 RepID=A0A4V2S482_9PSEU|nr:GNAT family N-acetyltransferase [Actinocrispum wychmicini]TCO47270.1 ribosomal protein S18 acetylase RimI-like enzyme [Actinocrispum wychmicini]
MIHLSGVVDEDVSIRPAEPADLSELKELDAAVFEHLAYPYFVLRQFFDIFTGWWMVAVHPDGLRGYSLGVPTFDRGRAWLLGLGVRPEFQGRGYGRSLTISSLRKLADVGVRDVHLTVEPGNRRAISLYRELGFSVETLAREYFGPGEDRLIMIAQL